ncbi:MAG: hypothetical protein NVS1B11_08080 [Terriglobales bacterium]
MEAIHGEQDASLHELFVVLAHLEQELWIFSGGVALTMTMNRIAKLPLGRAIESVVGALFLAIVLALC